jgi:hypothetical protein
LKSFDNFQFELKKCKEELKNYENLLISKKELDESKDILPFFRKSKNLASLIGTLNPNINDMDKLAFEYDIFGDFNSDLAIGDSIEKAYAFIEFEDAKKESIFKKIKTKSTKEWASRFDHGFSQIIDWFYKFEDMKKTETFEDRFNAKEIYYIGILIIGRTEFISSPERKRLKWREHSVLVNSKNIKCMTFDDLYDYLKRKITTYEKLNLS